MGKDLTLKQFGTFESATVRDPEALALARDALEAAMGDPPFFTRVGRTSAPEEVGAAMAYRAGLGAKAVLTP